MLHRIQSPLLILATVIGLNAHAESGLRVSPEDSGPFKARVQLVASEGGQGPRLLGAQLLGDFYVTGSGSGLRLSGGMLFGPHSLLGTGLAPSSPQVLGFSQRTLPGWNDEPKSQQPYLGLGYSQHSLKEGWGFSADLGLAVSGGSGLRLSSTAAFAQSLDESLRRLQWTPVLQVGVSYRF
jgi:hypothetical protein